MMCSPLREAPMKVRGPCPLSFRLSSFPCAQQGGPYERAILSLSVTVAGVRLVCSVDVRHGRRADSWPEHQQGMRDQAAAGRPVFAGAERGDAGGEN